MRLVALSLALGLLASLATAQTDPPYGGTIFLDPDIVTSADPSVYQSATYTGRGLRTVFDRRTNSFNQIDAYLFALAFRDGTTIEAQINPEFGSEAEARAEAETYGFYTGQLPRMLRRDVDALWIHRGVNPFGGGNRSILIHTGQSDVYLRDGILEETLIHEAAHTSLDGDHALSDGWVAAQTADPTFISTYARDFPQREDIAESVLPYLAVAYRADRVSQDFIDTVRGAIPNRIAYFDAQGFALAPFAQGVATAPSAEIPGLTAEVSPNPTADAATLRLTLRDARTLRVEVVDVLGRVVWADAPRMVAAGRTDVRLAVDGVPPGVYVVRVTADGAVTSRPLTVVR